MFTIGLPDYNVNSESYCWIQASVNCTNTLWHFYDNCVSGTQNPMNPLKAMRNLCCEIKCRGVHSGYRHVFLEWRSSSMWDMFNMSDRMTMQLQYRRRCSGMLWWRRSGPGRRRSQFTLPSLFQTWAQEETQSCGSFTSKEVICTFDLEAIWRFYRCVQLGGHPSPNPEIMYPLWAGNSLGLSRRRWSVSSRFSSWTSYFFR